MANSQNERIPLCPPDIQPVTDGEARPYWSVMIPVYNCADFLPATLRSLLIQAPGEDRMQIEVVDDASTDADVAKIVREMGGGRVKYFRQPHNKGSLHNFQTCIERSRGQWIHILHGDDRVRTGFYSSFEKFFDQYQTVGAAFCRYAYIDDRGSFMYCQPAEMDYEGVLDNWITKLGERQRIQYVSMVVNRAVYETLGSFYGVEYGEDWEMWMRIANRYQIGYIPTVLAEYRKHFRSISGRSFVTGQNMKDLGLVMQQIQSYLPEAERKEIFERSRKFYAHYAMKTANHLWKNLKHKQGAENQVIEAWRMRPDLFLFYKIVKLYTRMTFNL